MNELSKEGDSVLNSLAVIIQQAAREPDLSIEITSETSLMDDLHLDSLNIVDLLLDVEDHFNIAVQDGEIQSLFTVGDLTALVMRKQRSN